MFATPEQIKGEFWLLGTLVAKPGFEDKVQESFTLIAKSVQSGAEPGTLHYITTRGVGEKSNKFTIIEKYTSPEAFEAHKATEVFKGLLAKGTDHIESMNVEFTQEF
ncbi:hypothetical protein DL96DRAFT_1712590 [Flagelloscypha sp. PMI_526]|nr:hypothetical protein DL96DRAFT_1712590 [Flagelloscypha sp. PMI_526]